MRDVELIAHGPRSNVYRAQQILSQGIERTVAIKVLHGDQHELLRSELVLAVELSEHPNIVTVHDIRVAPNRSPCIVMEYCPLGSTAAGDATRSVDEVLAIGIAVADALTFIHARGVIHRDIKPDNILVRGSEPRPSSYALTDLGIARPIDAAVTGVRNEGTYLYASPQHLQAKAPAATDDIWSLGATLFTLLDGAPPFTDIDGHDTPSAYILRVLDGAPRQLRRDDAPRALRAVIERCLRKDPAARYPGAADLRAALAATAKSADRDRDHLPAAATTDIDEPDPSASEQTAPSALAHVRERTDPSTGTVAPATTPPAPRPHLRQRWISMAAAAAVVLTVGVSAVVMLQQHHDNPSLTGQTPTTPHASASSGDLRTPPTGTPTGSPRSTAATPRTTASQPQAPNARRRPNDLVAESFNGNRNEDLMIADPTGLMYCYPGKNDGGVHTRNPLGSGWNTYTRLAFSDFSGDGYADLWGTDASGQAYFWLNQGTSVFYRRTSLGGDWSAIDWFTAVDVNGDDKADLLARDADTMYLYKGLGDGTFAARTQVSTGWSGLPRHFGGDVDGDGFGDIWAIDNIGDLWFSRGNGRIFANRASINGGWQDFNQITVLDLNGDSKADIAAVRTSDGTLWRWTGNGHGRLGTPVRIGHGFTGYRVAVH